jgi:serine/threonine-protein kinase HipA
MSRQAVEVYAQWESLVTPLLAGTLTFAHTNRGGVFSFAYASGFLNSKYRFQLDPMLTLHTGELYNDKPDNNFRAFLDSSPDRWGRILMQRRAAIESRKGIRSTDRLTELDYLLGVHDTHRMGAIRFKLAGGDHFLDNNTACAAPPMASLRELEHAAMHMETDENIDSEQYYRWLQMLIAPGSSLGGARPKACVVDPDGSLWIAKFPNRSDTFDVGSWEMVCHELALNAGVQMFPCVIRRLGSQHHTFLTKRFDRLGERRVHFCSAMTQLGYFDGEYAQQASYLEIADFLVNQGAQTSADLEQLWRRVLFNIAISNTDDHLRNHGFLLTPRGWVLSPAFDLNPIVGKQGLTLNITDNSNLLSYDLAFEVIDFFRLTRERAARIYDEVLGSVQNWQKVASRLGISRDEMLRKQSAFNL